MDLNASVAGLPNKRCRPLDELPNSRTVGTFLKQIGQGVSRIGPLQELASAMVVDQATSPAIEAFASLGDSGGIGKNVERDLHNWMKTAEGGNHVELYYLKLHLTNPNTLKLHETWVPVLLPHEIFAAIWSSGETQQGLSLFGDGGHQGVQDWFQNFLRYCPWARRHPYLQGPYATEKVIGYVCHADGAEVYTNNEHCMWSFESAHLHGSSVWDQKFPIMMLDHSLMVDADVRQEVHKEFARFVAWFSEVLASGYWPLTGYPWIPYVCVSVCHYSNSHP